MVVALQTAIRVVATESALATTGGRLGAIAANADERRTKVAKAAEPHAVHELTARLVTRSNSWWTAGPAVNGTAGRAGSGRADTTGTALVDQK